MDQYLPSRATKKMFGEIEEIEDDVDRQYNKWENFIVDWLYPADHQYSAHMHYAHMGLYQKKGFTHTMEEERRLLKERTPSSIFVKAYKLRIDLMTAAFVAPPGSDYQHCLFFFDIHFPANYPNVPPKLCYRSYDVELNPNLRTDGRVRLDILDTSTWYDRLMPGSNSKEKWNPKESNILDVLRAIQNVISHRSPEPPSEEHGKKAFIKACEQMYGVLKRPPIGFESLVKGHFRRRAHPVLLKFKENKYHDEIDWFIRMMTVFEWNGAYCKHHLDFLKPRKQQITTTGEVANQEHANDDDS